MYFYKYTRKCIHSQSERWNLNANSRKQRQDFLAIMIIVAVPVVTAIVGVVTVSHVGHKHPMGVINCEYKAMVDIIIDTTAIKAQR